MKRYVTIAALAAAIVAFTAHDRAGAMTVATPAGMQSAVDEVTPIEQVRWWHGDTIGGIRIRCSGATTRIITEPADIGRRGDIAPAIAPGAMAAPGAGGTAGGD